MIIDGISDKGAVYKIVLPPLDETLNSSIKGIYIWCHGYRPVGIPLTAVFDYHSEPYATLLRRGFILASTSYRREGYILKDSVEDINDLRNFIIDKYCNGNSEGLTVILEAESMGGAIVTLLNERFTRNEFSGIIATGAALFIQRDPIDDPIQFLYKPKIPQIYICNSSEMSIVKDYIEKSKEEKEKDTSIVIPQLLYIEREGHCEVYCEELQIAFSAMFEWLKDETYFEKLNQEIHDITLYDLDFEKELENPGLEIIEHNEGTRGAWIYVDELTLYNEVILRIGRQDFRKLFIYPYNQFTIYIAKDSKPNTKFALDDLNNDQKVNRFDILHASYPFTGIQIGTLVSSFNVDNNLIIRRHFTGNNLNMAGTEMGVQISHLVFILEKQRFKKTRKVVN